MSVVNALSEKLEVRVKLKGKVHQMTFAHGARKTKLKVVGEAGKRETGTSIRFWPEAKYFDSVKFNVNRLNHVLQAKAVLCSGLSVTFIDHQNKEETKWCYEEGLRDYLVDSLTEDDYLPTDEPFIGAYSADTETVDWAVAWLPESGEGATESYVNLIPTVQGGTHVNGMRTGLLDAMREFCEIRNLLPRGVKLSGDDIWDQCRFVLSVKMEDPQFQG